MPTIGATVATIQAKPAPIVFLDSCVLLDIVRAPHRNAARTVLSAAILLEGARKNPPKVYLAIACPTPQEWADHIGEAVQDCVIAVESVTAVAEAWGHLGHPTLPTLPPQVLGLPDELRVLSRDLLDVAILLDKDASALSRALDRVINVVLPAKKGGKGAKDAVILEHALELIGALQAAGFTEISLFVSSNTADFAVSHTTTLHPTLAPLFGAINLDYFASLGAAVAHLTANGWTP
jgi:hypothetical protein